MITVVRPSLHNYAAGDERGRAVERRCEARRRVTAAGRRAATLRATGRSVSANATGCRAGVARSPVSLAPGLGEGVMADEQWAWLDVPYAEKDEAKKFGARWDSAARRRTALGMRMV